MKRGGKQGPSFPVVAGRPGRKAKPRDGRFRPGVSGNPAGRPTGSRNKLGALVPFLRAELSALQAGIDELIPLGGDYQPVPGRVRSRALLSAGQLVESYGHMIQLAAAGHMELRQWGRVSRELIAAFDRLIAAEGIYED